MPFFNFNYGERKGFLDSLHLQVEKNLTTRRVLFDMQYPSNPIEWAASDQFMGLPKIYSTRGQYYALREFFQCYCPLCSDIKGEQVFEVEEDYLIEHDKLLVWDWDRKLEYCPSCGITKSELIADNLLKTYNILLGIVGMRGGKTMLIAIILSYIEQFLIHLGDAKEALGLGSAPFLGLTCVAVSAKQAKDTIWAQYRENRNNSPWFTELRKQAIDRGYDKEGVDGKKLYEEQTEKIVNDVTGYIIDSLNSSSASLAGRTRVCFIIDELGRFDTTESKKSAKEVWRVGSHSLKTVRKAVDETWMPSFLGAILGIESPISIDDFGMRLLSDAGNIDSMFKMKYTTWDFNREYSSEDFKEEFELDYHGSQRDFGADPPGAELPYIEDWPSFVKMIESPELRRVVTFREVTRAVGDQTFLGKAIDQIYLDQDDWFICLDAGKSKDSFAGIGCKRIWNGKGEFILVEGFAFHILPDGRNKIFSDYTWVVDAIYSIYHKLRVKKVSFDYWDSTLIAQQLQQKGVPVEQYAMSALKLDDFFQFRNAALQGRVKVFPKRLSEDGEPKLLDTDTRLYWEMKRMRRSKDLKKIDHGPQSTSDLVECLVNCYRLALNESITSGNIPQNGVSNQGGRVVRFNRWGR